MSLEFHHKTYCGIQIGLVHAGFPFTRIGISHNQLMIKSLIGMYFFNADHLIRIEKQKHWLGAKYILQHNRPDYPQNIELYFIKDQGSLFFDTIKQSGFQPSGKIDDIPLPRSPIALNVPRVFSLFIFILQLRLFLNLILFNLVGLSLCFAFERSKLMQNFLLMPDRHYTEVQQWNRAFAITFFILLISAIF